MSHEFGTIISIGDILVSEDVVKEFFACDYAACKGVCCIEGDAGAPLDESELPRLEFTASCERIAISVTGVTPSSHGSFFSISEYALPISS